MKQMPTARDIERIRRESLENRAVEAYKFFYPTVSQLLNLETLEQFGAAPNQGFVIQLTTPDIVTLTQNSDTPYGLAVGDTSLAGPLVLEIPAGPVMGVVDDANFRFVTNMGLVGEEEGKGARYLFLPPNYQGEIPDGYLVRHVDTNRFLICIRVPDPKPEEGLAFLRTVKLYPLDKASDPEPNQFIDASAKKLVSNPCTVDGTFDYWVALQRALDADVPYPGYYSAYGMLADLGLRPGVPLDTSIESADVLATAAARANEQLAVAAFGSDDPQRLVWTDRRWEWVVYSDGDNGYYERDYLRLPVRERWFYQATLETPKMFMRAEGAGSLYWLGLRDSTGEYLDGGKAYRLAVPTPVPARQFWSLTVYDLDTRSEINAPQFKPVLTSLRDHLEPDTDGKIWLYFGPQDPGEGKPWVQTNPGSQWFSYFRIYGPGKPAFDGGWKLDDFEQI